MRMNNKKGVSTIVTVVLLILVSITAVALIAAFVVPFIKGTLPQTEGGECYSMLGKTDVIAGSNTCYDTATNTVKVSIKKGFTDKAVVKSFAVVLNGNGKSKRYDLTNGVSAADIRELSGTFGASINLPKDGETNTYVFNVTGTGIASGSVEVSPILSTDKVCEPTKAQIPTCA